MEPMDKSHLAELGVVEAFLSEALSLVNNASADLNPREYARRQRYLTASRRLVAKLRGATTEEART